MRREKYREFNIVEDAIELADKGLSPEASKLCAEKGIPIEVAHIVIAKPNLRRKPFKYLSETLQNKIPHNN